MAATTAKISWKKSVSPDAKFNIVRFYLDGELVEETEVGAGVESVDFLGAEEGRLLKVEVVVSDGKNESSPTVAEAVVPDVTAPEPVTELNISF